MLGGHLMRLPELWSLASVSFDRVRLLLFVISAVSVLLATLVAWLWVGNMVVRRLSRLSGRIRAMAAGHLDTPVPEAGSDEIGELASAVEVFRRQALEVQHLNLVEQLCGELRQAYEELELMQARLVARRSWRRWARSWLGWPMRSATRSVS